jgi:hypothetical protein
MLVNAFFFECLLRERSREIGTQVAFAVDGRTARVVCGTGHAGSEATGQLNQPAGLCVTPHGHLWYVYFLFALFAF